MRTLALAISLTLALVPLCAHAAQQPDSVGQDLAATIALHGLPCDRVVDSKRNSDSDYTATCQDGNRYHVFLDAQGRVVVQRLSR
jgi:hypothetical protein